MIPLLDVAAAGDYNAFYIAGFATAFALAARELNRSGAPAAAALALLAAAGIGGIVGSRLLFFDLAPHGPGEKTVLGGLVGGTLAFLGARTLLRVERASTDALAAALPIGMAVGRIGCFLAGCCFGRPTGAAWGVRYGPGTEPFAAQLAAGLIGPEATATVGVHPVQLYEAGLDVLLALALWRCGGRFRRRGSAFLAFLAGYAVLRVGVEAFRFAGADAATSARPGLVALAGVALAAALIRRELGARADAGRAPATGPDQDRPAARVTRRLAAPATAVGAPAGLATLGIAAGVLAVPGWLTPLERVVVIGLALPAVAAATAAATSAMRRGRRLAPLGATPALALVLLQTPQDSMPPDTTGRARYWSVGGGGMTGAYAETCGGDRRYAVGAASLGYTERLNRDERLSLRGQIFLGRDWQIDG
ncbi:MAG TPA: prolipoprotein diacylglyceryl transferase family protein, partial [Longimicrobiales bacterium]